MSESVPYPEVWNREDRSFLILELGLVGLLCDHKDERVLVLDRVSVAL